MKDLTVIFLTNNRLPESWQKFHKEKLLEAVGDTPIITMSRIPTNLVGINLIQDYPPSKQNIFYQILRAVRLVKTKYIAVVEDDTVYPKDHFGLRPPDDETFVYNKHRWSLYSWEPVYHLKNWIKTGAVLIAPTKLALDLLEERFAKYPMDTVNMPLGMMGELGVYEKELGLRPRKVVELASENPVVQLDTDFFTKINEEKETIERRHRKSMGKIKALSVPYWGCAKNLTKYFYEGCNNCHL
jgi:hypothetical protein